MEPKKVVYVTSSYFPFGQAYSTRVIAFSKLLKHLGYSVHVIADLSLEKKRMGQTDDYSYEIVGEKSHFSRSLVNSYNSYNRLKEYLYQHDVAFVIMNAGMHWRFNNIMKLCAERKIPLILEICEWYDKSSFRLKGFDPRYILLNRCMNYAFYSANGIIAISRLLADHFAKMKIPVIRIPTIMDTHTLTYSKPIEYKKIRLIHAGTAVIHKEKFKNILLAIKAFDNKNFFEFYIYGSDRATVLKNIDNDSSLLDSLDGSVYIMGKIPQQEVHQAYMHADYSIFIREDKRSSHAGFPTKLAESMVAGTPVITNDTGDIGLYLKNGENGYLIKDTSPESIKEVLEEIIQLSSEENLQMRSKARKTAEESFDFRVYKQLMKDFLEDVCG